MDAWKITVRVTAQAVKLLVTHPLGDEVLKARFPPLCNHPRALLTLLEGVALWSGGPLTAAISVARSVPLSLDEDLFSVDFHFGQTPLIRFEKLEKRKDRPLRIRGVGHFRALHQIERTGRGV